MIIRIREKAAEDNHFAATLSFDGEGDCEFRVASPFSEDEEQNVAWYFERHLQTPYLEGERARLAGESVRAYGEKLFTAVFKDNNAFAQYSGARQSGLENVRFEITGSPAFHKIHWEALADPNLPAPLSVACVFARKAQKLQPIRAQMKASPFIRLLIVSARSGAANDVSYRTIQRPLLETLKNASLRVQADILRPGTFEALSKRLEKKGSGYYHVIHFDAHGAVLTGKQVAGPTQANALAFDHPFGRTPIKPEEAEQAFLFLSGAEIGKYDPVRAADLAALLTARNVPIVILNACQSAQEHGEADESTSLASRLMEAGVQTALAMAYSVTVTAAEIFMETLYKALFETGDLGQAIRTARYELNSRKDRRAYYGMKIALEDWLLPVAYQNSEQKLLTREFTPEESTAWYSRKASPFEEAETTYGFFGRDLDILRIENRMLQKDGNILLVRGMGGAGKTTLLRHLGFWWRETQFVEQVVYFGYDEKAHTRQQILYALAEKLLTPIERVSQFDTLVTIDAQQAFIVDKLRATRHLLILDNLESITGADMAIRNTLPADERTALHNFLRKLRGGQTLILLGSRSEEIWLAPGAFDKNVHDLGGLDPQAASELAEAILKAIEKTTYRKDADFTRLLRLLDGYPLALQVILPNLKHQTPREIIEALQAGDVDFMKNDGKDKTTSILKCIEYGHSNLDAGLQSLLACLMPFAGVYFTGAQEQYIARLKEQPELAELPFGRFDEMRAMAENWGLLKQDEESQIPGYLRLQPTLSYFLTNRSSAPESLPLRRAIETAFRLHYDGFGGQISEMMESKEPQPKQLGQILARIEFENLHRALNLALNAHASLQRPYFALSRYLDSQNDNVRGLQIAEEVRSRIAAYPPEILVGTVGHEMISVVDNVARRYLLLKQYAEAESSYKQALSLLNANTTIGEEPRKKSIASVFHQLGRVAEEQRQWEQAEGYYKQALQIKIDFNDRYSQAGTYHQLGIVAQEQRQWEQAEGYYKQALQISVEFNDRYSQASTYHQLGRVAEEQRQWEQAEGYYKQALQISVEFNDRYSQASTYHQLGSVAEEQRQWEQAEGYYKQALQIKIDFNDRYSQAGTYHQLGIVAQEQRQWEQAEGYYKQALQIKIDFNDRYRQASTFGQLGLLAQEQTQWAEACAYLLQTLSLFVEFGDNHSAVITIRNLAVLWKKGSDARLPEAVADILGMTADEVAALLTRALPAA